MITVRATLNLLGAWVLWPIVRFEIREHQSSPQSKAKRRVEALAITPLFLSIEVKRVTEVER